MPQQATDVNGPLTKEDTQTANEHMKMLCIIATGEI